MGNQGRVSALPTGKQMTFWEDGGGDEEFFSAKLKTFFLKKTNGLTFFVVIKEETMRFVVSIIEMLLSKVLF